MKNKQRGAKLFSVLLGLILLLSSCSKSGERVVATCAGEEISADEMRYTVHYCMDEMEILYGEDIWKNEDSAAPHLAELEERVNAKFAETYAFLLAAEELLPDFNVDSEEISKEVQSNIDLMIDSYGSKSEYKNALKESFLTEKVLKRLLSITVLQMELQEKVCQGSFAQNEESLKAYLEDGNFVKLKKWILLTDEATATAYYESTDRSDSAEYVQIESAQYYFKGLEKDAALEETIFALTEVGTLSPLLPCEGGYCFYLRVEDDKDSVFSYQLSLLLEKYQENFLEKAMEPYRSKAILEMSEENSLLSYQ